MPTSKNQGEGDRESAQRFNERSQKFVKSEKGREIAKNADHRGKLTSQELADAEKAAASKAKEQDPEALRDYSKPAKK